MIRDRESLIRGYERELATIGPDEKDRAEAIRGEMARVRALPPLPVTENGDPTPVEREASRVQAYLDALRKERSRAPKERYRDIDAEIARIEAGRGTGEAERAVSVPKVERAVANPA